MCCYLNVNFQGKRLIKIRREQFFYTGEVCKCTKCWYDRISEGEILVYLKGDRSFGRARHRLEDDINECHHEIGRESVNCLAVGGDLSGELFTTIIMP